MIYLDHAATTPTDPKVVEAMLPYFTEYFGNPSSIYGIGCDNKAALKEARKTVAEALNCDPNEIIFTGSGTESDNLAILGVCQAYLVKNKKPGHIITSKIEHHAVLHVAEYLEKARGFEVTYLAVDKDGLVDPKELKKTIKENTCLASIIYANNEVGTVQDIKALAEICHKEDVLFHTDACQAMGYLSVDIQELGVDLMTINGSKIYGPKGTGALFVKKGVKLKPQILGGGQERGLRAGTENVPGIIGFAKAVELTSTERERNYQKVLELKNKLLARILKEVPDVTSNGHPDKRLPNNINVSVKGVEGESLLLRLDGKGIYVSTGSACSSGSLDPSHVLLALGIPVESAHGSLRLTLGKQNSEKDIEEFMHVFPGIVEDLRKISAL